MRATWMLVPMAVVSLSALPTVAQVGQQTWRATLVLVGPDELSCGAQEHYTFNVAIKGDVISTWGWHHSPYEMKLLSPLNPDGSGKVQALNHKNRVVTLDFDAGDGPRTIRYSPPYSICTWSWVPI
jgi:hypothetical protein